MKTYFTYDEARAAAKPGDEIWARDSAKAADKTGWVVLSTEQADEYALYVPWWDQEWAHWEAVK